MHGNYVESQHLKKEVLAFLLTKNTNKMLKIKLTQYSNSKRGKGFDVYLGNGTAYHFASKRMAGIFLNETSKFLTHSIFHLQELYIESWSNYQQTYFLLKINKDYKDNEVKRMCENASAAIEKARDLAIMRCRWPNGAYFTFLHLNTIGENIKLILRELRKIYKSRSDTAMLYRITTRYRLVMQIVKEIECFKEEESIYLFDIPAEILSEDEKQTMYIPEMKVA